MKLGGYEVLGEIGRGGVGVVYRARSAAGREVALKLLLRLEPDKLARFERERRLVGEFTARDGFVPLLDAGLSEKGPFLVMPLLAGGTLRDRLEAGRLGVEETIALGRTLAAALARAHQRGIVHRDMKPENILFAESATKGGDLGAALIADLGLAKHFDRDDPAASESVSMSAVGTLRGTAGYMPREQMHDARSAGPAADVFAVGAILYECVAGQRAFVGETPLDAILEVEEGRFEPLRAVAPSVPEWFARVVESALARAPEARPSDGAVLLRALGAKEVKERGGRPLLAGGAVGLAVVALVAGVALRGRGEAPVVAPPPRDKLTAVVPPAAPESPALLLVRSGEQREAQGDFAGALADYTRAGELESRLALAFRCRANLRLRMGDHRGAIADGDRVIALEPTSSRSWALRGTLLSLARDHRGALADFEKALDLDGSVGLNWGNRGAAREALGDFEGAGFDATEHVRRDPSSVQAHVNLGVLRSKQGDHEGAREACTKATELERTSYLAWFRLGFVKERAGDIAGAASAYEKAAALAPESLEVLLALGVTRQSLHETKAALDAYQRALRVAPGLTVVYGHCAVVRAEAGDLAGAIIDARKVTELAPDSAGGWAKYAELLTSNHDDDGAIAAYTKAIALDDTVVAHRFNRGLCRQRKRDDARALEDFDRAIALDPKLASAWAARASSKSALKDDEGAVADYTRAIDLDAQVASFWTRRGTARARLKDYAHAIEDLTKAIDLAPGGALAWLSRGDAREKTRDLAGAIPDFERYLVLVPDDPNAKAIREHIDKLKARLAR